MIGVFNSWYIPMEVCDHIDLMITNNFSSNSTLGMSMCKSTCGMIVAEKSGFIAADSLPWSRAYTCPLVHIAGVLS